MRLSHIPHSLAQLYSKLMPIPCQLCGLHSDAGALCMACQAALPRLGYACARCAHPLPESGLCGTCLRHPPIQHKTCSVFCYQPPVDRLIIDLKFHQRLHLIPFFARHLAYQVASSPRPACLIPIPLHPRRLRARGFNQAHELAHALSRLLSIPVCSHYLSRTVNTSPQSSLPLKQRAKNVRQAFRLNQSEVPAHIALIDDVITTGQTVHEAAQLFHAAGCAHIEVWTIARAIRQD